MSVKVRPYRRGGWEVDITFRLPNGSRHRERSKAPVTSKSAAQRWGEDRERHLLQHGPANNRKRRCPHSKTFAPRFLDGYARANRQKPSGIAAKETILNVHLIPLLGTKRLDAITNEDVQRLKHRLRGPSTEDGEQRADGAERAAEEGRGVGRDRADAVHDPAAADPEAVDGLLRLRRVRAAGRSGARRTDPQRVT